MKIGTDFTEVQEGEQGAQEEGGREREEVGMRGMSDK